MKNTKKGFVVPVLIVLVVVLAGGWGAYAYKQNTKSEIQSNSEMKTNAESTYTNESSNANTGASSNSSVGAQVQATVGSNASVGAAANVSKDPVITWLFPLVNPNIEGEGMNKVLVTIDGKTYDTKVGGVGCGVEISKSKLKPGQLSAAMCQLYAGDGDEIAVYKDGAGYKVVRVQLVEDPNAPDGIRTNGEVTTVLQIK